MSRVKSLLCVQLLKNFDEVPCVVSVHPGEQLLTGQQRQDGKQTASPLNQGSEAKTHHQGHLDQGPPGF